MVTERSQIGTTKVNSRVALIAIKPGFHLERMYRSVTMCGIIRKSLDFDFNFLSAQHSKFMRVCTVLISVNLIIVK